MWPGRIDPVGIRADRKEPSTGESRRAAERKPHILVVEDEPGTAVLISKLLKRNFGAEVEIAGDVAAAEALLLEKQFDIVTLDYALPDGNGTDLMAALENEPSHPQVLIVTGHGSEKLASKFMEMGATGYIVKDQELPASLLRAVGRLLESPAVTK